MGAEDFFLGQVAVEVEAVEAEGFLAWVTSFSASSGVGKRPLRPQKPQEMEE